VLNGGIRTASTATTKFPSTRLESCRIRITNRPILDFGQHCSADGIIEYRGNFFGGKLDGTLMVCRYNAGSDILCR